MSPIDWRRSAAPRRSSTVWHIWTTWKQGNLAGGISHEPRLARLGQRCLARLGFDVSAHTSGLQALEEFKASPDAFALVVSDQQMPHLSGIAFLTEVAALRPGTPALMVSGEGFDLELEELQRHGVCRALAKPYTLADLEAVVARLVPGSARLT